MASAFDEKIKNKITIFKIVIFKRWIKVYNKVVKYIFVIGKELS